MRTIGAMPANKQAQKALETMDIYAPLAGRLGMQWMREELEDRAFGVLNPDARKSIIRRFAILRENQREAVPKITDDIRTALSRAGIVAEVSGRAKKPFSMWRKMQQQDLVFSRLSDIYGFRAITETEADCYAALGAVHRRWHMVPGRFKDYISQPKSNGYRSIHTVVSGRDGKRVEVQIRSRQMDEVATTGLAAHWAYRDGVRAENPYAADPAKWARTLQVLADGFRNAEDHQEFLEHLKMEMYADKIFCFSPKGEVVKLPRGATPLDYAYAIHTGLGDSCAMAQVDGARVPLSTRLKNGQSVKIFTADGHKPQAAWLDIVSTGRAKAAIRKSLRDEHREKSVVLGRELARLAFGKVGREATEKVLAMAARQLALSGSDRLLEKLGNFELQTGQMVDAVFPELAEPEGARVEAGREVIGIGPDRQYRRAQCCQPVPGERIVGIPGKGNGVAIHAIDCNALARIDRAPEWIDVAWQPGKHMAIHTVTLYVTIRNDAGVLGKICTVIGERGANISDMDFENRQPDFYRLRIDVDLSDAEHLHRVMTALEAESDVARIARHRKSGESAQPETVREPWRATCSNAGKNAA